MAREAVTVQQAEELLVRAKQWESAYGRLLKAVNEIEAHGYDVTVTILEREEPDAV